MANLLNLRQLEVFQAVMEAGSITAAAKSLNVTQPAVTGVIKHAEQRLNMRLFEKIGGRIQPTPEAILLMPDVNDIFARVQTLNRSIQEMKDGRSGRLVIATTASLVNGYLPWAVSHFRKTNPGVQVALRALPGPFAIEAVEQRHADIGVVYDLLPDSMVTSEFLLQTAIVCVLPKQHRLTSRKSIRAEDLIGEPLISLGSTTMIGSLIESYMKKSGFELPASVLEANSSINACLLVGEGAGLALVDRTVAATRRFSDLVFRPYLPKISIPINLIFPRGRPRSRTTMHFTRSLKLAAKEVSL